MSHSSTQLPTGNLPTTNLPAINSSTNLPTSNLATINLEQLLNPTAAEHQAAIAQLDQACRQHGFFYISHYGVDQGAIDQMFTVAQRFFALPGTAKYQMSNCDRVDPQFRGLYLDVGDEALDPENPVVDLKEAFDFFPTQNYFGRWLQQTKPDTFAPEINPVWYRAQNEFCQVAIPFYRLCSDVCLRVLQALEIALQLPASFFQTRFGESNDLRLNYYPPCQVEPLPDQFRFSEHTDYGGITLLFQDVPGLQIRTPAGEWVDAPPQSGAVGVIVGDLMQRWTNDRYHSVWHRVVMSAEATQQPRYSLSFFCEPNAEVEVACLESYEQEAARYNPVITKEYLIGRITQAVVV